MSYRHCYQHYTTLQALAQPVAVDLLSLFNHAGTRFRIGAIDERMLDGVRPKDGGGGSDGHGRGGNGDGGGAKASPTTFVLTPLSIRTFVVVVIFD